MNKELQNSDTSAQFSHAGQSLGLSENRLKKIQKKSQETGISLENLIKMAIASQQEVEEKEARILRFYDDPKGDGSVPPWHLERIFWEYLKEFKTPEKTRKDAITLSIRHELNQLLRAKVFYVTNTLPDEVIKHKSQFLPPYARPVGNYFCTIAFHDRDEDDPTASHDTLIEFGNDHVNDLQDISDTERNLMFQRVTHFGNLSNAITFGRKTLDPSTRKEIAIKTHNNDPALYQKAINQYWETILAKAGDKLDGLITRFSRIPAEGITINKSFFYIEEAIRMYMVAQPLEKAQKHYPELSPALNILNNKIRVALVSMKAIVDYHPELDPDLIKTRGNLSPQTAEVDNEDHLHQAMRLAPWTPIDICDQLELQEGIGAEVNRHPILQPIFDQIVEQAKPHVQQLGTAYKRPAHDKYELTA